MMSLRSQLLALFCIVAAAFALRVRGLNHQVPQWTYWDGYVLKSQTEYLRGELTPDGPDRTLGYYPYLSASVAARLPAIQLEREGDEAALLAQARAPWMRPRLASLALSLFAVVGAWGIARRFARPGFALLAAALTATSLLHITYSTAQRPHGAASGMAALGVWAALYLRSSGGWRGTLVAATGAALAISALQSGFAVLVSCALAWWLRKERGPLGRDLLALLAAAVILLVVLRIAYPFHFDDRAGGGTAMESDGRTLTLAGHTVHLSKLTGRGFWILGGSFALFDPLLPLLAALAVLFGFVGAFRARSDAERERRSDLWVVLGYALPYLAVFGTYDLTFERFGLPLVPLLAVAAACACQRCVDFAPKLLSGGVVRAAGAGLVLALPAAAAWKLGSLRSEPDTYELAARWLEERALAKNEKVLLLQNFDLPVPYSSTSLRALPDTSSLYWTLVQKRALQPGEEHAGLNIVRQRQPVVDDEGEELEPAERVTPEWLEREGVRFVVALQASRGLRDPASLDLVRALRKRGKRALLLSPFGELPQREKGERELDLGFGVTEMGTALQVLRTRTYGPQLEIFEL
ncbi:MAG: hypothetical protein ACKO4Q_19155 [Planctomycetota bacterium]